MNLTPQQAADSMMALSEEQSRLSDQATILEIEEAKFLHSMVGEYKTAVATKMAWRASEKGIQQIEVENRLKMIKSELSVIKNYLRHCENSARNIY